ncbi:MAG: restriction endonuclease subunit S [Candidatus Micrarchaeia archaeon]
MQRKIKNKINILPKGWRKVRLGDWIELKYGFRLSEKKRIKGDVPVFGSSGILGWHNKPAVKKEGIIIGRKGNVGAVYFSEKPFYPIDTVYFIDSLKKTGDLKFFYYLLKTINFQKVDINVGVPGLNRDTAHDLEILIPENLDEQKRIAEILSAFDEKIELNNKINKTLEEMAQAIFKEWLSKNQKSNTKKQKLNEFAIISYGHGPSSSELTKIGYPVYGANGIIGYSDSYNFLDRQIIIGCRGVVGNVTLTLPQCSVTHNSLVITPRNGRKIFLYYLLRNQNLNSIVSGSVQPQITIKDLGQLELLIPDEKFQEKFESMVSTIEQKRLMIFYENQTLAALRDLLLPKLMSGEIRV